MLLADDSQRLVLEDGRDVGEHHRPTDTSRLHDLLGVLRGPGKMLEREDVLDEGVDLRLAVLARDQVEQLLTPAGQHAGEGHQRMFTPLTTKPPPPMRCPSRALCSFADPA